MAGDLEQNTETALRCLQEVHIGNNFDILDELFAHPDEWKRFRGRDGSLIRNYDDLKRYFERRLSSIDFDSSSTESVLAEDDEVMIRWEASGRVVDELDGIPVTGRDFETKGITYFRFSDGGIVYAHSHLNMLDFMPRVAKMARKGIAKEIRDGIVVVDTDDQIIDVNPATIETFEYDREQLLDEPVTLLFDDETPPSPGEAVVITGPRDRRYFEVEASPLTGRDDEELGRTLVFREITQRRRHVQQLDVLNRVLRHNLRNDLSVVKGALATVEDSNGVHSELLSTATEKVDELLTTAETARHIQKALDETDVRCQSLDSLVTALCDRAREQYPSTQFETEVSEEITVETISALDDALWEILENACEHSNEGGSVEVTLTTTGDIAELLIVDDGPGIPAHERRALESDQETDLEHGSGLGLYLAQWVLESSGGTLSFDIEEGTTACVELPTAVNER